MLLSRKVLWDDVGQFSIEPTLLQVAIEHRLEILIEVVEDRAGVLSVAEPVLLSSLSTGEFSVGKVGNLEDFESAVLSGGLDEQSTFALLLDSDVHTDRQALRGAVMESLVGRGDLVFGVDAHSLARLSLVRRCMLAEITFGKVIKVLLGDVLKVGDGECSANAA